MRFIESEVARLKRSRALLTAKLRRERRDLTAARQRHVAIAARVQRDERKIAELSDEIGDLE